MRASADLPRHFDPSTCATLVEILRKQAVFQPDRYAYTFLLNGEAEEKRLTYAELDRQARAIGATLQRLCSPGARVLLLYSQGIEYIAAFFGCLYANMVAVPAYPPSQNRSFDRIRAIAADAQAEVALTTEQILSKVQSKEAFVDLKALHWVATDQEVDDSENWHEPRLTRDMLCFLQYTSGSTGSPRGVMVSHGNLMHNSAMMCERWQHTTQSVSVSWLPMFHDMGLIAGVLQPLYAGFPGILMTPAAFLQRPMSWLQAISRYRGTTSYAPNFAFELCTRKATAEDLASLDLSSWRVAVNGAEPVRSETLERFAQAFASCGFRREALAPGYGLAEGTLMVSCVHENTPLTLFTFDRTKLEQNLAVPVAADDELAQTLVGCGPTSLDQKIAIVHPETRSACGPDEIGEIWLAGPSVAQGYWQRPDETKDVFQAFRADTGEGPFLRTGDLGFMRNGEILITGRRKDLIIIRGRNLYPQDIELTVERSHPSLRAGCGAAFSVEVAHEEQLVVVQEVARHYEDAEAIIEAIRQAIAEDYEIKVHAVVLIRYGSIFKTSSGKIQRRACREAFLRNELTVVASSVLAVMEPAQDELEPEKPQTFLHQLEEAVKAQKREMLLGLVIEQVHAVSGVSPEQQIGPDQNLLSLGIDSLSGTQLVNRLQMLLGHVLPGMLTFMMSEPTANKLVDYLTTEIASYEAPDVRSENAPAEKRAEIITPIQPEIKVQIREHLPTIEEKSRGRGDILVGREWETAERGAQAAIPKHKNMQFSLLYFASDEEAPAENKYELLVEGAKFADQHDFTAVWIPERHFHPFGGLYPNPSVLASALAMVTQKVRLRAGSVVLPMHHPLRVAEEWSVVDNLSAGRVDLAFAVGWNPNDFVLAPANYEKRNDLLSAGIETFQKLWRGEAIALPNGLGKETMTRIYPAPKQSALTPWITCTGSLERFIEAGAMGANILTGLLFQSMEELAEKLNAYRAARASHGHDPATGHITLMLHTFVGEDLEEVRQQVRPPFIEYLRSSVNLWRNKLEKLDSLSPQEQEQVLAYAFERYFQTHGLFGTSQTCKKMVDNLSEIGVDEIACLIDFGLTTDAVMDGLYSLNMLRKRCQRDNQASSTAPVELLSESMSAVAPAPMKQHPMEKERVSLPALYPTGRDQALPLSFAQQRLYFIEQLNPDKALYNEFVAFRLKGEIDVDVLELSFNEIVRRHEILRTTFLSPTGEVLQCIAPWHAQNLLLTDLRTFPAKEREGRARRMAEAEIEQPFDFVNGPLFKLRLFQLSEDDHFLVVMFHQAIADGWSISVFLRELSVLYKAYSVGEASPLVELSLQYSDYALWQQQWLQGEVLQEQFNYWQQQLKNAPVQLDLPTDRSRPAVQRYAGAQQVWLLPPGLVQQLKAMSQRENVTLFVTLLATFYVLLMRYSGQQDLVVGTPIANRARRELEDIIGFFANTLALRADLSGNPSFRQLLQRIREVTLQAYAHQDLPFEKLVAQLEAERDLSRHPLFQVAFVLQNLPLSAFDLPGVSWSQWELAKTTSKFDLVVTLTEKGSGLLTTIEYNTDLFEPATIERLFGHWQLLLEEVVRDVSGRIADLPLLSEAERTQILHVCNTTYNSYQQVIQTDLCMHQMFEQQVKQTPDSVALVFEQTTLTYQELNERANQVAHYLRNRHEVGLDTLVGLIVERSLEMVVSILGILKAGGAFVPLDPAYPQERLAFMLQDARVSVLLTQQRLLKSLPEHNAAVVCLDADWRTIGKESRANPGNEVSYDNQAYVIYTSGSTGKPKGVQVLHRGVSNLAEAQKRVFHLHAGDRVLQFASLSFDASVWEIVMTLRAGATLCLARPDAILPGPDLAQVLQRQSITCVTLPPSALAALPVGQFATLHTIISAGEACSSGLIAQWGKGRRFFNAYGPTETTVCATVALCPQDSSVVTIGRSIDNTQAYIMDDDLRLLPIGLTGELYIGGESLALGYLGRPELTAERFVAHPYSDQPGARLYKTGDMARYRNDGTIEFFGRSDAQVKVRGYRIELGEVEATLKKHPDVWDAAALSHKDAGGDAYLVAYVSQHSQERLTTNDLRDFLLTKLPPYMLPTRFVVLDALPLSPNGKVDRRVLSQLAGEVVEPSATYAPPQTAIEQTIARIWQEVLGLEKVGVHDNFFDLGGHSLLLGRVHDALRSALDQEVLIVDLFTYPTISLLIEHLNQKQDGEEEAFQQTYNRAEGRLASAQRQRRVRQSSALLQELQGDQDE